MRGLASRLSGWCIVAALAIGLTSVGFAHRAAPAVMTPELAAYIAAGGQLSDLCRTVDGEGVPATTDCEACRIADNLAQSKADSVISTELEAVRVFAFVAKRIAARNDLDPGRLTRAPPQA